MASTSETGHAKNVANFHTLITFCQGYGSPYNPSRESLTIANLLIQKTAAQDYITAVITKNTTYNTHINARAAAFADLKPLSTRIINALEAAGASDAIIADARTFQKKIQGVRATTLQVVPPGTTPPATISTSQRSYDQLIQHLEGLISVAGSEAGYNPNEADLKIVSLQEKLNKMKQKNDAVATAYVQVSNARLQRDAHLYHPETGLVSTAAGIKKYIKSVFGTSSPQYAQVSGIPFRSIRN